MYRIAPAQCLSFPGVVEGSGAGVRSQHPLCSQHLPRSGVPWEQGWAFPLAAAVLTAQGKFLSSPLAPHQGHWHGAGMPGSHTKLIL